MLYNAVGGIDLDACAPALRDEVLRKLRDADNVGIRDGITHAVLTAAGIDAILMPDPAAWNRSTSGTFAH